jgi:hypothetical protein
MGSTVGSEVAARNRTVHQKRRAILTEPQTASAERAEFRIRAGQPRKSAKMTVLGTSGHFWAHAAGLTNRGISHFMQTD